MQYTHNLPLLPEYTPFKHIYATLREPNSSSQNISEFTLPLIIYTPLNIYMLPSQNLPLPPRIYPIFQPSLS